MEQCINPYIKNTETNLFLFQFMQLKLNLHEANLNFTLLKTTISRQLNKEKFYLKKFKFALHVQTISLKYTQMQSLQYVYHHHITYNMGKIQALESLENCPWNKNSGMVGQTDNWM